MKNIILQHWKGTLGPLEKASIANMQAYAKKIGAEHKLMVGDCFSTFLAPQSQKLIMLDEQFDDYDYVVMTDPDMFTRKGLEESIFDAPGMGRHYGIQKTLVEGLTRSHPDLGDPRYPYWGGSTYKFDKATRKLLRKNFRLNEAMQFNRHYHDEGIMHRLAVLAKLPKEGAFFDRDMWNRSSFEPNVAEGNFIHIRTKITPKGPKRTKIENWKDLVAKGII